MIPVNTLRDLVAEEGLSEAELQVLSLALDGKSPIEIRTLLGIESDNAVQKRLGKIYTKFRITGAGPGKLPKLQTILTDRFQTEQGKKKVLICWSGSNGKRLAEELRDVVFKHPRIDALVLGVDMNSTSLWLAETEQLLKYIDFGITCLGRGFSENPSVNFAIGFLSGRLQNFKLVRFSQEELAETLIHFPTVDGTDKDNLAKLLYEIIGGDPREAKDWVDFKLSSSSWWEEILKEELDQTVKPSSQLVVNAGLQILKDNECFRTNKVFRQLITDVLTDVGKQIEEVGSSGKVYSFPIELYPRYLVSLQQNKNLNPIVKAIAVIENVEHFWANDQGDEIGKTANKESERLFVFSSEKSFKKSTKFLLEHASQYKVFVTTLDTYLPLASEFFKSGELTQWKEKDYSLPTKEYAIIKTSEEEQLLIWYDEDNLKDSRHKRLAKFSAILEQVSLYEKAFEEIKKAQGVFLFPAKKVVITDLKQLEEGLFQQPSITSSNIPITPKRLLEDLQTVRNKLVSLKSEDKAKDDELKGKIIKIALEFVRQGLHYQTASIFLFHKDGRLHREAIQGVDVNGSPIDNNWFADESYAVGESFTGKAALTTTEEDPFGKPQSSNSLSEDMLDKRSQHEYTKKLGKMSCAIAVPLDGQSKTYGVLEVINKVNPTTNKPLLYCSFGQDEIHWLSAVGSSVATTLSNLRRDRQNRLYTDLANFLIESPDNPKAAYDEIVHRLISDYTSFEVCILRIITKSGSIEQLEQKAIAGVPRIKLDKRIKEPIKIGDELVWQVVQSGKPKTISKVTKEIDKFKNQDWIEDNQLKSFGCFPLIYQNEVLGTLSVYTGYEYDFHPSCRKFLLRVGSLIAAFIGRVREKERNSQIDEFIKKELPANLQEKVSPIWFGSVRSGVNRDCTNGGFLLAKVD